MQQQNVFFATNNYQNLTDEEIIAQIKLGDEKALTYLLDKYKELVNIKVGKYFLVGGEKEDVIQEGMIGLYKAIKNFDKNKKRSCRYR